MEYTDGSRSYIRILPKPQWNRYPEGISRRPLHTSPVYSEHIDLRHDASEPVHHLISSHSQKRSSAEIWCKRYILSFISPGRSLGEEAMHDLCTTSISTTRSHRFQGVCSDSIVCFRYSSKMLHVPENWFLEVGRFKLSPAITRSRTEPVRSCFFCTSGGKFPEGLKLLNSVARDPVLRVDSSYHYLQVMSCSRTPIFDQPCSVTITRYLCTVQESKQTCRQLSTPNYVHVKRHAAISLSQCQ